jgi:hypothetical protein
LVLNSIYLIYDGNYFLSHLESEGEGRDFKDGRSERVELAWCCSGLSFLQKQESRGIDFQALGSSSPIAVEDKLHGNDTTSFQLWNP